MKTKKIPVSVLLAVLVSLAVLTSACGARRSAGTPESQPASGLPSAKVLYLKNNIHAQQHEKAAEYRASYSNWTSPGTGHVIVPVNTQVSVSESRRGLTIVIQSTKKPILFEFNEKTAGMKAEEYSKLILSPEPVQLNRLPELDRKGIKEGKAYPGMTKEGVRIALGYPAPHRTPSLESNTWVYWTNRFKAIAIEFDEKGKVKTVGR